MSTKNLLYTATGEEEGGLETDELPSGPETDSDWLSDGEIAQSPFQEGKTERQYKQGFLHSLLRRVRGGRSSASTSGAGEYRVYCWRWFMLATLSLLNLSNGMVGLCHYVYVYVG